MSKKIILTGAMCAFVTAPAIADGLYVNPKLSLGTLSADESRVETMVVGGKWNTFPSNKHETWGGDKTQLTPKIAIGYDFNLDKYGIVSVEAEYGRSNNYFDAVGANRDLDGNSPNDSDTRNFSYNESTISLNAKYGYRFEYVTPFVTAGIGYSTIESTNNFRSGTYWWNTKSQDANLSWNIGAGVEIPVTDGISFNLAYVYTNLGNVEYSNYMYHNRGTTEGIERKFDSSVDLTKQEIVAGMKIAF